MPKKINIDIDFSSDNTLLAVSCHKKDYWMAYNLNETLKLVLRRIDDLPFYDQGLDKLIKYSLFHYFDPDTQLSYYLISNYNPEGKLFRAHKTTDFFILYILYTVFEVLQSLALAKDKPVEPKKEK